MRGALVESIREALDGIRTLHSFDVVDLSTVPEGFRDLARRTHGRETEQESAGPAHHTLSEREFEVLVLLAQGQSVKNIAISLALSMKTVSTYRARLLHKLQLTTTAELIRYALEHQLVE